MGVGATPDVYSSSIDHRVFSTMYIYIYVEIRNLPSSDTKLDTFFYTMYNRRNLASRDTQRYETCKLDTLHVFD